MQQMPGHICSLEESGNPLTVEIRRLHSLRIEYQANRRSVSGQKSVSGKLERRFEASGFATKAGCPAPPQTNSNLTLALMGQLSLRGLAAKLTAWFRLSRPRRPL